MVDEPQGDEDRIGGQTEDSESTSKKSERKRQREKQRRSDLANAFDELASLLQRIEPEDLDSSTASRRRRRRSATATSDDGNGDPTDTSGMTRLDLIGRTIEAMKRLHHENYDLRRSLEDQRNSGGTGDDREVLVMVPTLTPAEDGVHPGMHHHHQPPPSTSMHQQYYGAPAQGPPMQHVPPAYQPHDYGPPPHQQMSYYQHPHLQGQHYHHYPPTWGNPPQGSSQHNQQQPSPHHQPPPPPTPPGQPVDSHPMYHSHRGNAPAPGSSGVYGNPEQSKRGR